MDLAATTAPRSDQQNFDDYVAGPKTLTISEVRAGTAEQPVEIHVAEYPGRPYKPSKSMRRVLVQAWGSDGATYAGRRITLYGDPDVTFGRDRVGGIKISHLSHITKPIQVALTVTRGKRAPFTVQPLPDAPVPADQVSKAVTAVHGATSTVELDKIVAHARKLGLDGAAELVTAIGQKRGELEVLNSQGLGGVDHG
jgi:hypothetical protein